MFSYLKIQLSKLKKFLVCLMLQLLSFTCGDMHAYEVETEVKEVGFTAGRDSTGDKKTKGTKIYYTYFTMSSQP